MSPMPFQKTAATCATHTVNYTTRTATRATCATRTATYATRTANCALLALLLPLLLPSPFAASLRAQPSVVAVPGDYSVANGGTLTLGATAADVTYAANDILNFTDANTTDANTNITIDIGVGAGDIASLYVSGAQSFAVIGTGGTGDTGDTGGLAVTDLLALGYFADDASTFPPLAFTGTLDLTGITGANTFTGGIEINTGVLRVLSTAQLGIPNPGGLAFTGTGALIVADDGNLTFDNNYDNAQRLVIGTADTIVSATIIAAPGSTFSINHGASTAIDAGGGGAIEVALGSTLVLTGTAAGAGGGFLFESNTTALRGGAIFSDTASTVIIDSATFNSNTAGPRDTANGGAIETEGGTIIVRDSVFSNNATVQPGSNQTHGGAIAGRHGAVIDVANVLFTSNTAYTNGGVIFNNHVNSMTTVASSTFANNTATMIGGGAICILGDGNASNRFLTVTNALFMDNFASRGGAIQVSANVQAIITSATFQDNRATAAGTSGNYSGGGAIVSIAAGGTTTVNDSLFKSNSSLRTSGVSGNGGAITIEAASTLIVNSSTFDGNSAGNNGGAIHLGGGNGVPILTDVSFFNNTSGSNGGAINATTNTILFKETISATGNTAGGNGGVIYNTAGPITFSGTATFTSNTATGGGGGVIFNNTSSTNGITFKENATFTGNTANGAGAAIRSSSPLLFEQDALFVSNTQTNTADSNGGAIHVQAGGLSIQGNATFQDNHNESSLRGGGAIYIIANNISITGTSDFSGNSAAANGGAIYFFHATGTLTFGSYVSAIGNTAGSNGGVIYSPSDIYLLDGGNFSSNAAVNGGAIAPSIAANGSISINSTGTVNFTNNTASGNGGALYFDAAAADTAYAATLSASNGDITFSGNTQGGVSATPNALYVRNNANASLGLTLAAAVGSTIKFLDPIASATTGANLVPVAITKTGAGTVLFDTHQSDIVATTTVSAGAFKLTNGAIYGAGAAGSGTGTFTVLAGGTLAGNGTIRAKDIAIANGATLTPSTGDTLTGDGDVTLAAGATLGAHFLATGAHGTLAVSGALDIAEGAILQLALDGEPGAAVAPGQYKLVSAAAGITGSFAAPATDALGASRVATLETRNGQEIWVNVVDPNAVPGSAPTVSTEESPTNITHNGFTATWGAVAGATGYKISISTSENFADGSFVGNYKDFAVGNMLTFNVSGLDAETTYYYRVRATNDAGESAWSTTVIFTTTEAPPEGWENVPWAWVGGFTSVPGALARDGYIATHWAGSDADSLQIRAVSAMQDAYNEDEDEELAGNHDGTGWDNAWADVPSMPGETWRSVTRVFQYNPGVFYGTLETTAPYDMAVETLDLADLAAFWELIQGTNVSQGEVGGPATIAEVGDTHTEATIAYPSTMTLDGSAGFIPQINELTISNNFPVTYGTSGTITVGGGDAGAYTLEVAPVVPADPGDDAPAPVVTVTLLDAVAGTFEVKVINGSGSYQLIYGRAGDPDGAPHYAYATAVTAEITTAKAGQATLAINSGNTHTFGTPYTISTGDSGSGTGAVSYEIIAGGTGEGSIADGSDQLIITTAGTFTLKATKAEDANYNAATSVAFTLTVGKANQETLTIVGEAEHTYGTAYALATTGGSGTGTVTYTITGGTGEGSIADGSDQLIITTAGTFTLTATKAADANYNAVISGVFTLTVNQAEQKTLSIVGETTHTYGTVYTITSEGGSGTGAVSYTIVSGDGSIINGDQLIITTAGTFTLKATKTADANYNVATSDVFTLEVGKANQRPVTITSTTPDGAGVSTITIGGGDGDGNYTLVSNHPDVATVDPAEAASGIFTVTAAGNTGTYTLTYGRKGNANYEDATEITTGETDLSKIAQTTLLAISDNLPEIYDDSATITVSGGDGSGNYTLISNNTDVATVDPAEAGDGTFTVAIVSGTGFYTLTYGRLGDTTYNAATSVVTDEIEAKKANQPGLDIDIAPIIDLPEDTLPIYYGTSGTITISNGTGTGAYTLVSNNENVAFVDDEAASDGIFVVSIISGTGSYTLTYGRDGDDNYNPISTDSEETEVFKARQADDLDYAIASDGSLPTCYNTSGTITITGGSGEGAYTLNSDTGVATVTPVNASDGIFTVTVSSGTGTYKLTYGREGDDNYEEIVADNTIGPVDAKKATQTPPNITSAETWTFGTSYVITSTIDGPGTSNVSYTVTPNENSTGIDTGEGTIDEGSNTLNITKAGTITFTATRDGSADYESATATLTLDVGKATQSDTLALGGTLPDTFGTGAVTITITGGDIGDYTLSSDTPAVATVNKEEASDGNFTVTIVSGTGSYKLTYGRKGNDNYDAISGVTDSIGVNKGAQGSLTITNKEAITYDPDSTTYTVQTTGGSTGGAVTLSRVSENEATDTGIGEIAGDTLTITQAGTFTLKATMAGNANYLDVDSEPFTLTVNKATQGSLTITNKGAIDYIPGLIYTVQTEGGNGGGAVTLSLVPESGDTGIGTIADGSDTLTITQAGTFTLKATMTGNANYLDVDSEPFTLTVNKATQGSLIITNKGAIDYIPGLTYIVQTEGGNGGGAVTLVRVFEGDENTGEGTIAGDTLTVTKAGTFTLKATKADDVNYGPIDSEQFTLTINKGTQPALTLSGTPPNTLTSSPVTLFVTGGADADAGGGGAYTITSTAPAIAEVALTNAGTGEFTVNIKTATGAYTLNYTRAGNDNYNEATGTTGPIEIVVPAVVATLSAPVIAGTNVTITATGTPGNYYALYASDDLLGLADSWTLVEGTAGRFETDTAEITFTKSTATARFYRLVTSATTLDGTALEDNPNVKFSTNVVGHYAVTIPTGASRLVALQLDCAESRLDKLFTVLPNGSLISRADPDTGKMSVAMKSGIGKWTNGTLTLANGAAALVKNGSTTAPVTLEFAGLVNTDARTHTFTAGQQKLLAAHYPVTIADPGALGYVPAASDTFNRLTEAGTYAATVVTSMGDWPEAEPPALTLAEGFFLRKVVGGEWTLPALDLDDDNILIIPESDIEDTENTGDAGD